MRYIVCRERILLEQRTVRRIHRSSSMKVFVPLRPHVHRFVTRGGRYDRALVGINVVQLGASSLLRLANAHGLAGQKLGDLAIRVKISGNDGMLWANNDAGGF